MAISRIGEVCIMTGDVVRLADFYRSVLGVAGDDDSPVHQFILAEETSLTIYNDGSELPACGRVRLAFTVEDIYAEHERLLALGVSILEPPTVRPWGATNLSFSDPDGNTVTFRSYPGNTI